MSKDLKKMIAEIRGALDQYPREQLQEILAWVFKEYVVEGGAAPAASALAMLDARTELEGLSFAELVTWLQLHLDVPELAALEVQGQKVHVRHGGRAVPIEVAAPPPVAPPVAAQPAQPTQPAPPPPQPMVSPSQGTLAPPQSSDGRTPNPAPNPTPTEPPKAEEKKDESNPSSRFSWLEVD